MTPTSVPQPGTPWTAAVPPSRAVLFDLDGTLVDSYEGLAHSYEHVFASLSRPSPDAATLRDCVGPPLRRNLRRLLATDDDALVERAVALFRERYGDLGWRETRPYDGAREMVAAARAAGRRVFVATGKPKAYADRIVALHGFEIETVAVYGPGLDPALDDKRRLVAHALARESLAPPRCALVGDRENDVTAARANGVLAIGVTWGYGTREELTTAGASIVCDRPGDVLAHV